MDKQEIFEPRKNLLFEVVPRFSKPLKNYLAIEDVFNQLANFPDMGKSRDELFPGTLSFSAGSHIVFYRKTTNQIEIARVLHKRMDYGKYFNKSDI